MALSEAQRELASHVELAPTIEAGAAAGLIGGVAFGLWSIIAGLISGQGPLSTFALFGATFAGVSALLGNSAVVLLGVLLHLIVSALLGSVFAALIGRGAAPSFAVFAGLLFGVAVLLLMTFVLTPAIDPILRERIPMMRGAWVIQHLLFGASLAWVPWLRRRITRRADSERMRAFNRQHARSAPPSAPPPF